MGSGQGLGGCMARIKYLMFAFNFIFWLVGCALVGFGIWVLVDDTFRELTESSKFQVVTHLGICIIAVGCVIMIVGFFGCCGAIRESKCLLIMFFVCMFIMFAGLVGAGVYFIIYTDQFIASVSEEFTKSVKDYDEKDSVFVNAIQKTLTCCGADDYKVEYAGFKQKYNRLPASCPDVDDDVTIYSCNVRAKEYLKEYGLVLGGITIGAGAVMLIGMIFSMMLCCSIRDNYD